MADVSDLAGIIAQALNTGSGQEIPELIPGKVATVNPLSIQVINNAALVIPEKYLLLSETVKRKVVEYDYQEITFDEVKPTVDISGSVDTKVGGFYVSEVTNYAYDYAISQFDGTSWTYSNFVKSITLGSRLIEPNASSSHNITGKVNETLVSNLKVEVIQKEIVLWEDLKVGEEVRMLRSQGGQEYYVLGRA